LSNKESPVRKPDLFTRLLMFTIMLLAGIALAAGDDNSLRLQKVGDRIYAVVGPFGNRSPDNLGNNATFGFVVTDEGVVLVDSGGSHHGAAAIEALIRQVTDQPVKVVINSGGQDHRWLGNGYFKQRGARIIASAAAAEDQRARVDEQMFMLHNLVGTEGMAGTKPMYADETFDQTMNLTLGGISFELLMVGPAHTPGDSLVWLPEQRVVFSGDVVYVGRLLGVMPHSKSGHWIEAFETLAALNPATVVPGHGPATDLARARTDSLDYLVFLRDAVGAFMEGGGDITQIGTLDQSRFAYLEDYETLKGRNAQQVFEEMEWE
jgi:glyoxylase-like metal-dependent hydrolase (beta-lactamase superfamily II)